MAMQLIIRSRMECAVSPPAVTLSEAHVGINVITERLTCWHKPVQTRFPFAREPVSSRERCAMPRIIKRGWPPATAAITIAAAPGKTCDTLRISVAAGCSGAPPLPSSAENSSRYVIQNSICVTSEFGLLS